MEQNEQNQEQELAQEQNPAPVQEPVQQGFVPAGPGMEQENPFVKKPFPKKAVIFGAVIVVAIVGILLAVFLYQEPLAVQTVGGISCGVPKSWETKQVESALKCTPPEKDGNGMLRVFYLETGSSVEGGDLREKLWEEEGILDSKDQGEMTELTLEGLSVSPARAYRFTVKAPYKTLDCYYLLADYANGQAAVGLELAVGSDLAEQGEKLFQRIGKTLVLDEAEEQKLIDGCVKEFEKVAEPLEEITLNSIADIDAAQEIYDSFSPIVQEAIPNGKELLESSREAYNQKVDEVAQDMIERIDAVGEVTLEKKDEIEALAREHDALPLEAREKIDRSQVLRGYLSDIDSLEKQEEEKKAVAEVEEAINAIGEVTLDSGPAIKAADEKWDALSESLQEKVSNADTLAAARTKYYEMKKAKEVADKKQELLNNCVQITYDQLARNPDDYIGKAVWFRGKIVQVVDNYHYRVNITQDAYGWDDTVYVDIPFDSIKEFEGKLLEDDIITVYGSGSGTKTYTSIFGASITIPEVEAKMTILG